MIVRAGSLPLPWYELHDEEGRWLAEAEGIEAARSAARFMVEEDEATRVEITAVTRYHGTEYVERCQRTGRAQVHGGTPTREWR